MGTPDAPAPNPAPPQPEPSASQAAGRASWLTPYLLVLALGLMAALIVAVQLWGYRDELRSLLSGAAV